MQKLKHTALFLPLCIAWLCTGLQTFGQSLPYNIKTAGDKYTFNYNEVPQPLMSVSGYSAGSYYWEQSPTPLGPFSFIPGASSATYSFPGHLDQTTYFRRYSFVLGAFSNTVKIEIVSVSHEDLNYVREHDVLMAGLTDWKAVDRLPIGQKLQTTTYLDGLGRPIERVSRQTATPEQSNGSWGDVVLFSQFDHLARQPKQYLPYTTAAESGKFKTLPVEAQAQYYSSRYNESPAYTALAFEKSPLNRTLNVKAPGAAWAAGRGSSTTYDLNGADDQVQIFTIGYNNGDIPVNRGAYAPNTLLKTVHTDEEGKQVIDYTTSSGQPVLTKTRLADHPSTAYDGWICTYSVYDDFGLLRYRLQPEAVKYLSEHSWSFAGDNGQKVLNELCFRYEYDEKGRTVLKKAPGAVPLYMLYDSRDRLVFMQDGNQRKKNEWTANLYDELDRTTLVALYHTTKSATDLQIDVDNAISAAPVTITYPASQTDLVVRSRQPAIPLYTARNSIEFVPGFESGDDGDLFTAETDPLAAAQTLTVSATAHKSPISPSDLNNPGVTTIVSYDFYDNYTFSSARPFNTSFDNGLAYSSGAEPITATQRTTSLQTGSMVRVLGSNLFLSTTLYYDEKGRPIQALEDNIKSGTDVTTLQYGFDGRLLNSNSKHATSASGPSSFSVVTKNNFDVIGRITSVDKKYGTNPFTTIAAYDLDDMGRLKTKHLSPGYTGTGKAELESLGYSYNIHSQITGINRDYALKEPGYDRWNHFFGLYLGYDNRDGVFARSQLDGHVTGTLWTSQGDDVQRKYDFMYDGAGRLTSARFNQREHTSDNWSHARMDFSVKGLGTNEQIEYDLNGNLLNMLQKGVVPGNASPQTVDELHYQYAALSNKLTKVTDNSTLGKANGQLGDFADGTNSWQDDYVYDDNGNLVLDRNKKAPELSADQGMAVSYNFLDKPEEMVIPGKGTIRLRYDADGNKLQKVFTPAGGKGHAVTTTYINEYVYQEEQLQYINFEEGRIRVVQATSQNNGYDLLSIDGNMDLPGGKRGAYDYFVRDYQGNVRMILTEGMHQGSNTCTMETTRAANEEPLFGQVDETGNPTASNEVRARFATLSIPGQASGNGWQNSQLGDYVSRVGNLAGSKVGPNTLLRVMAGDEVNAVAQYYYQRPVAGGGGGSMLAQIISALAQAIGGSGVASGMAKGAAGNISQQLTGSVPFGLKAEPDAGETGGSQPKAYLTVLFFDERFEYIEEGSIFLRVSQSGSGAAPLVLSGIKAPRNGYAYVYVSNSSDEMVYFDNMQVAQTRGRILEENHYYAYGLRIAGISSRKLPDGSEGHTLNRDLYNDKELIEDGDLDWYDYGFRSYDAQIGRFTQLDPLTDDYPELTPYQYAGCEPIANVDMDGLEPVGVTEFFQGSQTIDMAAYVVHGSRAAHTTGSFLSAAISLTQNTARMVSNSLTRNNLAKAADIITDFIPIVGGAKDIYNGIKEGNGWKVVMGVGSIALDVVTFGGSSVAKGGIKTAVKVGAEVLTKREVEQVAIQSARKLSKTALQTAQKLAEEEKAIKRCMTKFGCFTAGTLIWRSDSTVSIENIRVGDVVYAYDVKTKKLVTTAYEQQIDELMNSFLTCSKDISAQTVTFPSSVKGNKTISFRPMNVFIDPELLANVWDDRPVSLSVYTDEEKSFQNEINAKTIDGIMSYSPIGQKNKYERIDFEDITPFTWKWVDFDLPKEDGTITKVNLLRPNWWLRETGIDSVGKIFYLSMPEMGAEGYAKVTAIRINQIDTRLWKEYRKGDYLNRPVTGRFEHESDNVYNLTFESNSKPLGVTGSHPIWSIDRNDWVAAGNLRIGESIKTQDGITRLASKQKILGKYKVYNLEIYRDHTFLVSTNKILTHNNCLDNLVRKLKLYESSTNRIFQRFKVNGEYFKFGSHHTEGQWYSKLKERGWTEQSFEKVLSSGIVEPGFNKVANSPATWHLLEKGSDMRILVDNTTKEIIQVGGKGFGY